MSDKNFFVQIFGGAWHIWYFLVRLVIALAVTLVVVVVLVAVFGSHKPTVPASSALVINLHGNLVEQFSGDPVQRALAKLIGQKVPKQTRLRDVVTAIENAKSDARIKALVIEPDDLAGGGLLGGAALSDLRNIAHAIGDFRATGKPVFALGDSYTQSQYYLASMANTVFIHPQGQVFLHGYGLYQPYFKDALDKLGVTVNVFRVGKYKSAMEPFMLNGMSPAARKDWGNVVNTLWTIYQQDVDKVRDLKAGTLDAYVSGMGANLAADGGDGAQLALKSGLVDKVATEDQMVAAVAKVVGKSGHSFRQIDYLNYLKATGADTSKLKRGDDTVGVIVAAGDIMTGDQPPGAIGGESTSELIRKARYNPAIKALVLRVDSPGGSAFASDLILRQIELTKEAGKPVIVSMGALAASGGYWISMAGDRIYADPATLTGSIGIFGYQPTFSKALAKIGIHSDGVGTTPLSDSSDPMRPMSAEMKQAFQASVDFGYRQFITNVARNRHMSVEAVNAIAQGRVWTGEQAKKIGLVDRFGNLQDAIAEAAKLAKLSPHYSVRYIERPLSLSDKLLIAIANSNNSSLIAGLIPSDSLGSMAWLSQVRHLTSALKVFSDPRGVYAYCFCNVH